MEAYSFIFTEETQSFVSVNKIRILLFNFISLKFSQKRLSVWVALRIKKCIYLYWCVCMSVASRCYKSGSREKFSLCFSHSFSHTVKRRERFKDIVSPRRDQSYNEKQFSFSVCLTTRARKGIQYIYIALGILHPITELLPWRQSIHEWGGRVDPVRVIPRGKGEGGGLVVSFLPPTNIAVALQRETCFTVTVPLRYTTIHRDIHSWFQFHYLNLRITFFIFRYFLFELRLFLFFFFVFVSFIHFYFPLALVSV